MLEQTDERPNHVEQIRGGFSLVERVFEEFPQIHIEYREEGRVLVFNSDKTKVVDSYVSGFKICRGADVPEAIERLRGIDPEKLRNGYVIYYR